MTPEERPEQWMPNGFPPPSFVVGTERSGRFGLGDPRNRWLAATALLGALLILVGALYIAEGDDDQTALRSGSSSTTLADPAGTTPTTQFIDPAAGPTEATLPADGVGSPFPGTVANPGAGAGAGTASATSTTRATTTTRAPARSTPAAAASGTPAPPKLEAAADLTIPDVVPAATPQSAKLGLRNTGGSPLSYTAEPGAFLSADPPTGTIGPGATTEVTVTLDGKDRGEGAFNGEVILRSDGGDRRVAVTSFVGQPPTIQGNGTSCSGSNCSEFTTASPCTTPWKYRVRVEDPSGVKSVTGAQNGDRADFVSDLFLGPDGTWISTKEFPPLGQTPISFTIGATDQFDLFSSVPGSIPCP